MSTLHVATLGGGCFWCLDAALRQLPGVESVVCGYAGGNSANPGYDAVCSGRTGHAEVVQIRFDAGTLPYRDLLQAFFLIHDPTTLNRQGHDVGSQYRSVIFTHDAEQARIARELIAEYQRDGIWPDPIVTEVVALEPAAGAVSPAPTFWPAEDYHQDYFAKHPAQPYCQAVVAPKVAKLRLALAARLRSQ